MNRRDIDRYVDEQRALAAAAAPMVHVRVQGDCRGKRCPSVSGRAKLDTGAASTFIAPSVIKKLKLKRRGHRKVYGIEAKGRQASEYAARLNVAGVDVPMMRKGVLDYVMLDRRGDVALIGRDAMAGGDGGMGLNLEYDGPSGRVRVKKSKRKGRK